MIQVSLDTSFLISFADPEDGIPFILTEDANTLSRIAARLRAGGHTDVRVLLLSEGFTPGRLGNPDQNELPLAKPPTPAATD